MFIRVDAGITYIQLEIVGDADRLAQCLRIFRGGTSGGEKHQECRVEAQGATRLPSKVRLGSALSASPSWALHPSFSCPSSFCLLPSWGRPGRTQRTRCR